MTNDITRVALAAVIRKMPLWLRSDLSSADPALRQRAEESLLAIVLAAIDAGESQANDK
jgi:hypothetical protein